MIVIVKTDIDECDISNGGCQHNCTNTIGSFVCSCNDGYNLTENGLNCTGMRSVEYNNSCSLVFGCCYWTDFNECESGTPLCDENAFCINTDGGFHCICDNGYTGSGDIGYCNGMLTVCGISIS